MNTKLFILLHEKYKYRIKSSFLLDVFKGKRVYRAAYRLISFWNNNESQVTEMASNSSSKVTGGNWETENTGACAQEIKFIIF